MRRSLSDLLGSPPPMQDEFNGGVFAASIDGGRAGAMVCLEGDAVVATTRESLSFRVPYRACELDLGGASGRMWFCRIASRRRSPSSARHRDFCPRWSSKPGANSANKSSVSRP